MNSFLVSTSFGLPVVQTKAAAQSAAAEETSQKVKVSSLPLYPEPEKYEYYGQPPSKVQRFVQCTRTHVTKYKAEYQPYLDKVSHVVNTGRAHTNDAIIHLREEGNLVSRIGAMAVGGLLGLLTARKGRMIKKITYISAGVASVGSLCYPHEAKVMAFDTGNYALKNAKIAYHFIAGSRPAVQNQDGNAFKKMSEIGVRLFQKKSSDVKVEEGELKQVVVKEIKSIEEEAVALVTMEEVKPASAIDAQKTEEEGPAVSMEKEPEEPGKVEATQMETDVPVEEPIFVVVSDVPTPIEAETTIPTVVQIPIDEPPVVAEVAASPAIEGDLGQGNLEDKELYTTRD